MNEEKVNLSYWLLIGCLKEGLLVVEENIFVESKNGGNE